MLDRAIRFPTNEKRQNLFHIEVPWRTRLSTAGRKDDHIRINLEEDVSFRQLTSGFEHYHFTHQALPEIDLTAVDTSVIVLGKRLSAPIQVSSMTGGTAQAGLFNQRLAEAVQERNLAMGVGSQRAALEDTQTKASFFVRTYAPDALIFANLGAVQLNYGYTVDQCRRAVDMVEADALILHLNPLQEVLQPEGDTRWGGLLSRIEEVCAQVGVPIIVKEVGWGIGPQVARNLIDAGVSAIDVAGAGGTSWSEVEKHRAPTERQRRLAASFREWGIPTVTSLAYVREARAAAGKPDLLLFASGGVRNGQDVAKAAALGADLAGLASPFLKRAVESTESVVEEIDLLVDELRIAMFASGSPNIEALRQPGVLVRAADMTGVTESVPLRTHEVSPTETVGEHNQERLLPNPKDGGTGIGRANPEPDMLRKPPAEMTVGTTESDSQGGGAGVPGSGSLSEFTSLWLPKLEDEMKSVLATRSPLQANHYAMMHYHMGWADEALRPHSLAAGKRIRPLLCLIACEAVGGNPANAIPAAAAVEILHNFSLVHDDIEDGDELRRHRPTVWALWGVPQAINVGDGLFALAFSALMRSAVHPSSAAPHSTSPGNGLALAALEHFTKICIGLTEGQHLDLSFEEREDVTVAEYLQMIKGKTAALVAGSVAVGALFGGADTRQAECMHRFGHNIGLAFQIQDDILGIWGDPEVTGKAAGNDILRRKKSLPMLFGLEHPEAAGKINVMWRDGMVEEHLAQVLAILDGIEAKRWSEEQVKRYHNAAMEALYDGLGDRADDSLLLELANQLLQRQK